MAERVLLIGMMGAGKTTVGRLLAERLGWPHLDSDEMISRSTGKTVSEIFEERGEAAFRAEEARVLAEAATSDGPAVVSVAGGAVLAAENRKVMRRAGPVVWLRADLATLAVRVGSGKGRPLLGDDPAEALRRLEGERRPLYSEVADVVVDVDNLEAGEVVDRIVAGLA
ncbi:MAG: shikimate kinase [Actinomycetota bacterium]